MKHMKKLALVSLLLASMMLAVGCGTDSPDTDQVDEENAGSETTADKEAEKVTPETANQMIAAIDVGNLDTEAAVEEAWLAYCALDAEAKAGVSADRLVELRQEVASCYARTDRKGTHMERSKVLLGSYPLVNTSEEHIREVAEAGLHFMSGGDVFTEETMNLMQKYGLAAIPHVTPIAHDAIWGVFIRDEPSAALFADLEKQRSEFEAENPDCFGIITLLPNYANDNQLGTNGYQAHIDAFVNTVDTDIIMYDFYMLQGTGTNLAGMLENLRIVSNACRDNDRDMWLWLQANGSKPTQHLNEDQLRAQANISMAYGTTGIMWACWTDGWWYNNIYDAEGNKTELYDFVKTVNTEINQFSPTFIKYKHLGSKLIGKLGEGPLAETAQSEGNNVEQSVLTDLKVHGEKDLVLCGWFEKKMGTGNAMMFVNLTNKSFRLKPLSTVTFSAPKDKVITLHTKDGSRVLTPVDGVYTIEILNAEYAFVTVD